MHFTFLLSNLLLVWTTSNVIFTRTHKHFSFLYSNHHTNTRTYKQANKKLGLLLIFILLHHFCINFITVWNVKNPYETSDEKFAILFLLIFIIVQSI